MPPSKLIKAFDLHGAVSTDTRKIRKGDIFFALKGDNFNGNEYAAKAIEAGASFAVIDEKAHLPKDDAQYVLVEDVLETLQGLARHYRRQFDIPFISITGTNGKTTTKELLHAALATEKRVHATKGNLNNHIGVPLTLLAMPRDTEIAIIEMGANKRKDIGELMAIAEPTHGLITNIGRAHLERFGDIDGVQETKGEMFGFLREAGGCIFLNLGDARVTEEGQGIPCTYTYNAAEAEHEVLEVETEISGMKLQIRLGQGGAARSFSTQLIGAHNVENVLAAVVVAQQMGISEAAIRKGIAAYTPRMNRTQIIQAEGFILLLDAYNANPSSMEAAVRTVKKQAKGPAALILGDMFELGVNSQEMHRDLVRFVKNIVPDARLIGVGEEMSAAIAHEAPDQTAFATTQEAQHQIANAVAGVDFILVKGSRGMVLEKLLPALGIGTS